MELRWISTNPCTVLKAEVAISVANPLPLIPSTLTTATVLDSFEDSFAPTVTVVWWGGTKIQNYLRRLRNTWPAPTRLVWTALSSKEEKTNESED